MEVPTSAGVSFAPRKKRWLSSELGNKFVDYQSSTMARQLRQFSITAVIVIVITLIFATIYHITDNHAIEMIIGNGTFFDSILFSIAADLGMVGESVFLKEGVKRTTKIFTIVQLTLVMSVLVFTLNIT